MESQDDVKITEEDVIELLGIFTTGSIINS